MKIEKLMLAAFGPFTDRVLEFSQPGLHIVYGPNEAGKSSSLRALKALLYGIDNRSRDNFIHTNTKLRIGGTVRNSSGDALEFYRRKGNKNTLLSADQQKLDDQALTPFLHGVSGQLFETLFAIDHRALVQGGQQILEQQGEVGQALFSAALGSHALRSVLGELDVEARGLFLSSASNPKINANIKIFKELKREIKESSLSSSKWEQSRQTLKNTSDKLSEAQEALRNNRSELNRLKRVQRVLPKLARRKGLLQQLEEMKGTVELRPDFGQRYQQAVHDLKSAQGVLAKQSPRLEELKAQLDNFSVSQNLLDRADSITDLYSGLGTYRQALQDRPELVANRQYLLTECASLLREIRPDLKWEQIEILRPLLLQRQNIIELGSQNSLLTSRVKELKQKQLETSHKLEAVEREQQQLPLPRSSSALSRAIAAARKLGGLDAVIQSTQTELLILQKACDDELSRLTLWAGELQDVSWLAIPTRENISHFEQRYDQFEQQLSRNVEVQDKTEHEIVATQKQLDEIQRTGDIPTEADLISAREKRNQFWQRLRQQWIDGENVYSQNLELDKCSFEDYEKWVRVADDLSDRLRRESDRVSAIANLKAREKSALEQQLKLVEQQESLQDIKIEIDEEWHALWSTCGLKPETPREMRGWLERFEALRIQVSRLTTLTQELSQSKQVRMEHMTLLSKLLFDGCDVPQDTQLKAQPLESMLVDCEAAVQEWDKTEQKRNLLDQESGSIKHELALLESSCQLANSERENWQQSWDDLLNTFGLKHQMTPADLNEFIEQLRILFDRKKEIDGLNTRIEVLDRSIESFSEKAESLRSQLEPDMPMRDADQTANDLYRLLTKNRSIKTQREHAEQQFQQASEEVEASFAIINEMNGVLSELCKEAKCSSHEELDQAQRLASDYQAIKSNIEQNLAELIEAGEGADLEQLQQEINEVNPDQLASNIELLVGTIDQELEPQAAELAQLKGREEKSLELMSGGVRAAELAEQAQAVLASIRSDAEHYIRVKLAAKVLRDEIESYRKQNQGPLIKRASEHFSALTQGSFESLMTDFNDKDEPVLEGVRTGGSRVLVEGMSTGSRDQLYLALRLASLEKYMENAEPMPFIVDDILVDFDDKRSEAALNTLSAFADKTQVILFTHHSRVVDQALGLAHPAQIHEL
ncbi:MAG: AAA family ATPase [Pseudomonadales bacterium]|nr:AAA family ATPase [Pseudomonadales bacterium]